jgi:Neisseria PilC beta-propeller domain
VAVLAGLTLLGGDAGARVSPLTSIEQQVQKPNMLFLFDVSTSMMLVPGTAPADFYEAGMDCDRGDNYCRTLGNNGRCYFSGAGSKGQGVQEDPTSCTNNAQCQVSYCAPVYNGNDYPKYCTSDADCSALAGDTCQSGLCKGSASSYQTYKTCTSDSDCATGYCRRFANDWCVTSTTSMAKIKMCRIAQTPCRTDAECTAVTGDACGPASSRMVLAKSAMKRVVNEFYDNVNFGFMTFGQTKYYPYYEVTGPITYSTRETFIPRTQLEFANCFTTAAGPSASCTISGTSYTRKASSNSRYRLNKGIYYDSYDLSWAAGCSDDCAIAGVGTGVYEGTYYTYQFATAPMGDKREFDDFTGRVRTDSGTTYIYFDAHVTKRNVNNIHGNRPSLGDPIGSENTGRWDPLRVPFMDTSLSLPLATAKTMAQKISTQLEKVSMGGLYTQGGTPTNMSLKNDDSPDREHSAYYYLRHVQQQNAANNVACRPEATLLVTDGAPGGAECTHDDCALSPPGPGCTCEAVLNARAIYKDLGAKVYTIGFSAEIAGTQDLVKLNNLAKAGGTPKAYIGQNEAELYTAITSAIYDSIKGSYATSPITTGAAEADGKVTTILDSRADFPSWRGHLIAYDVSGSTPVVKWDVATGFDATTNPDFWKQRNVWTSSGASMIKIQVDAAGTITNAATLRTLGLGVTDAEAALVARWMLGDPALGNQAVPGAFVNSTPTEVRLPSGGSLLFVGSSDGMLHAFHGRNQNIGSSSYAGGREAFAYIPQDMLPVIRRKFAQGGERPAPREHVYGLGNSPKIKKICTANCNDAVIGPTYKYVLVMPEGLGGSEVFALDVTTPFDAGGVKSSTSPVSLLWHTEHLASSSDKTTYDAALGKTMSLPAYYFGKSADLTDYRMIFASGYTEATNSAIGLKLVTAKAATGVVQGTPASTLGLGAACALPKLDPTEPTLLADVAVARRFAADDKDRIAAAYFGDTWGNLFRWVPTTDTTGVIQGGTGSLSVVDSFTCNHPLHFSPTIVQLDRTMASKSPGAIFIAQLTNSALDTRTAATTASYPATQLIIRKDLTQAGYNVVADSSWGTSGRISLSAANPSEICAVGTSAACSTPMPANARPIGTSTGIVRDDLDGFGLVTLWYVPDTNGCNKGRSFITVHDIPVTGAVSQIHGEEIANEPVVGAVFVAGKLLVVRQDGPKQVIVPGMGTVREGNPSGGGAVTGLVDRYRRVGWTELP